MCKEDVRLARAAVPGQVATATGPAAVKMLGGNAERYGIQVGLLSGNGTTGSNGMLVYALIGGLKYPLLGLSADHPAGTVTIMDVGDIIMGEIWCVGIDQANNTDIVISETKWNQTQDTI